MYLEYTLYTPLLSECTLKLSPREPACCVSHSPELAGSSPGAHRCILCHSHHVHGPFVFGTPIYTLGDYISNFWLLKM